MGDAGPLGFGWHIKKMEKAGLWSALEAAQSTNYRELRTWEEQVIGGIQMLRNTTTSYTTDSTVAHAYMKKIYGKSAMLTRIAARVHKKMEKENIIQWGMVVNQETIAPMDRLSRLSDKTDIALQDRAYQWLTNYLNLKPTLDTFATRFTNKCPKFYSRTSDPLAAGTNTFTQPWQQEKIYAFPPTNLIWRTINKIEEEGCRSMVITPNWPTKPWFHRLKRMATKSKVLESSMFKYLTCTNHEVSRWRAFVM